MCRPTIQTEPASAMAATPVKTRLRLPGWLLCALLVLGTTALYWPAMRCDFVILDDGINVSGNVYVQNGLTWEGIKRAFFNPVNSLWQPVATLSHMAVCQVFGLSPWGHHLTNVLLHALNAALVFAWLRQMTGATWRSLLVAVLFAVHPLRVEPVTWVTERREVLSTCFGLLALMAYVCYAQGGREKAESRKPKAETPNTQHATRFTFHASRFTRHPLFFYALSLCSLALGLMSKPTLVTWPLAMLLLDYWPLDRLNLSTLHGLRSTLFRLVREKVPFFVLVGLSCLMTFLVQERAGALGPGQGLPLGARVGNALISYCRYLGKMFWPANLAVAYPHPGHWPLAGVLLAGGLLLGISMLVWVQRRRHPYVLVGWLWYCGTLVPISQVIQTGSHAMADRWTYIPSLGVLMLVVWGVCALTRGWRYRVLARSAAGGMAILACLPVTRYQLSYWRNSETLLWHTLDITENNYLAHRNLGFAYYMKGQMDEALSQFQKAVRLEPDAAEAHDHLGITFFSKGQLDEAIRQFGEALRLNPDYADAHYNLGVLFYQQGRTDQASRQFKETIRLKPDHAEAHHNLGVTLGLKGEIAEAIRQFQEALRLQPDYADARKNLDLLLATRAHSSSSPGAAINR